MSVLESADKFRNTCSEVVELSFVSLLAEVNSIVG